jgi:sterol desaturase/sphingolipid hydroxylase (fatty acid hydroxylase superfamily)
MHVEAFWLERSRWFTQARTVHDIHYESINDEGLMDKNFGIGLFFFDRVFGTLQTSRKTFNYEGPLTARKRFSSVQDGDS